MAILNGCAENKSGNPGTPCASTIAAGHLAVPLVVRLVAISTAGAANGKAVPTVLGEELVGVADATGGGGRGRALVAGLLASLLPEFGPVLLVALVTVHAADIGVHVVLADRARAMVARLLALPLSIAKVAVALSAPLHAFAVGLYVFAI